MANLHQLAAAHGFTLEALAMNRAGQIHPAQQKEGTKKGVGGAIFIFSMAFVFLAGGLGGAAFFYDTLRAPVSSTDMNAVYAIAGGGVLLSLGAVAGGIVRLRNIGNRRQALQAGALQVLEGPITKIVLRGNHGIMEWIYEVNGHRFRFMPKAGWDAILPIRYRVYCVAGEIVSLEPIG